MISTGDFKRGTRILVDGEPCAIDHITVQTPSARGAATLVRCKLRNIVTGALLERTFKGGEKFEVPDVNLRKVQFLYDDGESCHFMENENYEQFALGNDGIENARPWFSEEMQLDAVFWNGRIVGVTLPVHVEAVVDMVGGGARSDTAGGKNLKDATLTNGVTIKVPLFVENGEKILVDPSTGDFVRRA
jgi:elongation factor P